MTASFRSGLGRAIADAGLYYRSATRPCRRRTTTPGSRHPRDQGGAGAYTSNLFGKPVEPERFFVTEGGMHAIQICIAWWRRRR